MKMSPLANDNLISTEEELKKKEEEEKKQKDKQLYEYESDELNELFTVKLGLLFMTFL